MPRIVPRAPSLAARVKTLRVGDRVVRRNPLYYRRFRRLFRQLAVASVETRISWTGRRLATVLRAARETEYGRDFGGPLESWPILEKELIRAAPRSFVRGRAILAAPAATSGTTGTPLSLWRSPTSLVAEQAAIDRLVAMKGVDFATCRTAVLRGDDIVAQAGKGHLWREDAGGRRLVLAANHVSPATIDAYASRVREFGPEVLHAYPTSLESFCRSLNARDIQIQVPVTLCSSEVMSGAAWSLAESTLSTEVIDYYGQAERAASAYAFEFGCWRFLAGYAFTELLPVGEAGTDGRQRFEIVATGLWNLTMPLVRLRTGDLIEVDARADVEEVRWGVAPFEGVVGRSGDFLVAPDGAWLVGIDHIPRGVPHVIRSQVVQDGARVEIRVVTSPGFGQADRDQLIQNAMKKLPNSMTVEVVTVKALRTTSGGKTPFVIREGG